MSNVSCNNLLRFAQIALRLQPETLCLNHLRHFCSSTSYWIKADSQDRARIKDNNERTAGTRTGSSSHQSYHRTAYERKKQDYQRDRTEYRSNERSVSYMSSPSTTHYQRLNIEQNADVDRIKSAYYTLSKQYHPDIVGKENPNAVENFRLITESYDILSDAKARADYDKQFPTDVEPSFNQSQTAWRPAGTSDRDYETLFRMREANRIFKSKQEEALEKEKQRNPGKFRAGSFKYDDDDTTRDDLAHIERQISSLTADKNFKGRDSDSNHFYRVHLYDTLHRRRQDLEQLNESRSSAASSDDSSIILVFASIVGLIAFTLFSAVNLLYDIDLAALVDARVEKGFRKHNNEDTDG